MDDEEKVRRAAHIILDGLTAAEPVGGGGDGELAGPVAGGHAHDESHDHEADNDAMALAFQALLEIEALEITFDEEEEELELDISPLMSGVLLVVRHLVAELAQRDGSTPDEVVALVRGAIDAG